MVAREVARADRSVSVCGCVCVCVRYLKATLRGRTMASPAHTGQGCGAKPRPNNAGAAEGCDLETEADCDNSLAERRGGHLVSVATSQLVNVTVPLASPPHPTPPARLFLITPLFSFLWKANTKRSLVNLLRFYSSQPQLLISVLREKALFGWVTISLLHVVGITRCQHLYRKLGHGIWTWRHGQEKPLVFRDKVTFDVDELKEIFGHLVNSPTGKYSHIFHSYRCERYVVFSWTSQQ